MQFMDRVVLGDRLAGNIGHLQGKHAVIICLQESALLTCVTVASKIRAWVYPLLLAPVLSQDEQPHILGAYTVDDNFYSDHAAILGISDEIWVAQQKARAVETLSQLKAAYNMDFDPKQLANRDIVLIADTLSETLPLVVARQLITPLRPKSLTITIGNATVKVAELAQTTAETVLLLDILPINIRGTAHYFANDDTYDLKEKRTLARYIANYWQ